MPSIWWARRDLRLADNPALVAATETARAGGDEVVALYVLDPRLWDAAGAPRRSFLARSLAALDEATGGRLVVRHGDPRAVVPAVARETGAEEVHVAASFEPYGVARDEAVERSLTDAGARLVRTGSPYAVAPGRVLTKQGDPFQVFTPFRDAWVAHGWRAPAPRPRSVPWARVRSDGTPEDPGRTPTCRPRASARRAPAGARSSPTTSPGTRASGTARTGPRRRACRCRSSGASCTRARCSPTCATPCTAAPRPTTCSPTGRSSRGASSTPTCCSTTPARRTARCARSCPTTRGRRARTRTGSSRRGPRGARATRSSTRGCASSSPRAGCTTACAWSSR